MHASRNPMAVACAAISLCGAALLPGCGGSADGFETRVPGAAARRAEAPVAPWAVALGESGGFTGGGQGHVIEGEGRVRSWSRITPDDTSTTTFVGIASRVILQELETAMRDPELRATTLRETGNLTVFLEWREPPRVVRWSWADRGARTTLPPSVRRAVAAAEAVIASARDARETVEGEK